MHVPLRHATPCAGACSPLQYRFAYRHTAPHTRDSKAAASGVDDDELVPVSDLSFSRTITVPLPAGRPSAGFKLRVVCVVQSMCHGKLGTVNFGTDVTVRPRGPRQLDGAAVKNLADSMLAHSNLERFDAWDRVRRVQVLSHAIGHADAADAADAATSAARRETRKKMLKTLATFIEGASDAHRMTMGDAVSAAGVQPLALTVQAITMYAMAI